jgi:15-cis-phytoene synthase
MFRLALLAPTCVRAVSMSVRQPESAAATLMAHHARTFYFATSFLRESHRSDIIRLYAFFRTLDDLVDERVPGGASDLEIERELEAWSEWFSGDMDGPAPRSVIGADLADVVRAHAIPLVLFEEFLDGLQADLRWSQPETVADLTSYSYRVASTVGIAMTHTFDAASPAALDAARRLGIAMQWTNILRDVGGDLERGRLYLPKSELERHSMSAEDLFTIWRSGNGPDHRLRSLIGQEVARADREYAVGLDGVRLLPEDVRLPIFVAGVLYQRILRALEANDYDSLRTRVSTNRREKIAVAGSSVVQMLVHGDASLRARVG